MGDRLGESAALGNLGSAYYSLEDYENSRKLHEQSLEIARATDDRHGEGRSLFNIGQALYKLGDHSQAIRLLEFALTIYESIEAPEAQGIREQLKEWRGSEDSA